MDITSKKEAWKNGEWNCNPSSLLWEKSKTRPEVRLIYISLLFMIIALMYVIMHGAGVLVGTGHTKPYFSFLSDYSNSVAIAYILPIAMVFGGYYRQASRNTIEKFDSTLKYSQKRTIQKFYQIMSVCELVSVILALMVVVFFVSTIAEPHLIDDSIHTTMWTGGLSDPALYYYCFILFCTWYFSLLFAVNVVINCVLILIMLYKGQPAVDLWHYDGAFGFKGLGDMFTTHISMALYYGLGGVLIVLCDFRNQTEYGIVLTFASNVMAQFLLFFAAVAIVTLAVSPVMVCRRLIREKKALAFNGSYNEIVKLRTIEERSSNPLMPEDVARLHKEIEKINGMDDTLLRSSFSRLMFFVSVFIPMIGIVIQIVRAVFGK